MRTFASLLIASLIVSTTSSQETPLQVLTIDVSESDDGESVGVAFASPADSIAVFNEIQIAPTFAFGSGGMSFMPQDDMGIVNFPQFADELEIVEDQQQQLRTLGHEIRKARQQMIHSFHTKQKESRKTGNVEDATKIHEHMMAQEKKFQAKLQEGMSEILLPHQIKRLEELKFQMKLRNQGARALANSQVADLLDITDEQRKELHEKQREKKQEINEQIAKLREEARKEILDEVLTDAQRMKLAELMGEKYVIKRPQRQNQFFEPAERGSTSDRKRPVRK